MTFQNLYALYFHTFVGYCQRLAAAAANTSAEDLAQEAFLRALSDENFPSLEAPQQRAWLNRTARNLAVDHARRRSREPPLYAPETQEIDLTAAQVGQALDILDPDTRKLVALRYFAGWNSTQIGKLYGLAPATVRTRLRAAARKLREFYCRDT